MPCPNGVMRSCTTRWRRWFCSAVKNGLGGGQTHNQYANLWLRGGRVSVHKVGINISQYSPQFSLKRLQGLCVFLLTRHLQNRFAVTCCTNKSKTCRFSSQILITVYTFKQNKPLNPELVKQNSAKTFTNIKQVLHIKRHGLNSTNSDTSVNFAYGQKKKNNLD